MKKIKGHFWYSVRPVHPSHQTRRFMPRRKGFHWTPEGHCGCLFENWFKITPCSIWRNKPCNPLYHTRFTSTLNELFVLSIIIIIIINVCKLVVVLTLIPRLLTTTIKHAPVKVYIVTLGLTMITTIKHVTVVVHGLLRQMEHFLTGESSWTPKTQPNDALHGLLRLMGHLFSSESSWAPKTHINNSRAVVRLSFWCSTRPSADTGTD